MNENIHEVEQLKKLIISPVDNKKYRAILTNGKTVDFGDSRYQHYKDQTPIKNYSYLDHRDTKRRKAYFQRHSNEDTKIRALNKEIKASNGKITAKILAHFYLW